MEVIGNNYSSALCLPPDGSPHDPISTTPNEVSRDLSCVWRNQSECTCESCLVSLKGISTRWLSSYSLLAHRFTSWQCTFVTAVTPEYPSN
eukprot:3224884-Amphidinium_carterae.1